LFAKEQWDIRILKCRVVQANREKLEWYHCLLTLGDCNVPGIVTEYFWAQNGGCHRNIGDVIIKSIIFRACKNA